MLCAHWKIRFHNLTVETGKIVFGVFWDSACDGPEKTRTARTATGDRTCLITERFTVIAPEVVRFEAFLTKQFHQNAAQISAPTKPGSSFSVKLIWSNRGQYSGCPQARVTPRCRHVQQFTDQGKQVFFSECFGVERLDCCHISAHAVADQQSLSHQGFRFPARTSPTLPPPPRRPATAAPNHGRVGCRTQRNCLSWPVHSGRYRPWFSRRIRYFHAPVCPGHTQTPAHTSAGDR